MLKVVLFANGILVHACMYVEGQYHDWCIADEQTPDDELVLATKWACENGADCTKIQENQPCYHPNTVTQHASYAFNSYYQNMKLKGATCYFNSAAVLTARDPSKFLSLFASRDSS
ncbi:hypothetical protein T459_29048 [Capsicum annuum]|uniref:X8 domain-containing protein n=1 Tax=Capsicum annuum TaxID=4072 RepID=A0A2G2Y4C3_CAPAN|nr:hypothetical protein T459_29048 [Capsicum annuum]